MSRVSTTDPGPPPTALCFAHLNLRRNPFGEPQREERAALAVVDVSRWVWRLKRPGVALQFMAPPGHGKTTTLLAIMAHFPQGAYLHVEEGRRPWIPRAEPLAIDEWDRLSRRWRRRVLRRQVALALGTHEDFSQELLCAGYEVETVWLKDAVDADRLWEILNRRIEWARRGPGPVPRVGRGTARALVARFGGNLRAIERLLYEQFQHLGELRDV
ncbi:MAG TPA: hypothetical protein EYP56_01485 [Planctomycetaceae bacterium]|nr:hypothetical protein [Planctomycetaceae bacterium]HIQ21646.1 hypothetical protein [Planctomycetota bacterium]